MDSVASMAFRPRARLMVILGSDQVTDPVTAAIELVKNAYDADATEALVELESLTDPDSATITISDNGCGMTREDIQTKWLSPAVGHRQRQKAARIRTPRGRLPIGEKGVGRFSTNKLGRSLFVATRAAGEPEQVLEIDWDEFETDDKYLDEIPIELSSREPQAFEAGRTGTFLRITRLRDRWNRLHVRALHRGLRRLQSPFTAKTDFRVVLKCPDFREFEELDTSDILDRAHYMFRGYINEDGLLDYRYECKLPGIPARTNSDDAADIAKQGRQRGELGDGLPACGPFYLNLYVWDRRADLLKAVEVTREDLDDHCGISLFRDGLRVLPYGDEGDDWLNLNRERINDPSRRIGNNQVIGYVEVNQEDSPDLRDKTNREGLIDNDAFRDLRALVRSGVDAFTKEWYRDRPRPEPLGGRGEEKKVSSRQSTPVKTPDLAPGETPNARQGETVQVPIVPTSNETSGQLPSTAADVARIAKLLAFVEKLKSADCQSQISKILQAKATEVGLEAVPPGRYTITVSHDGTLQLDVTLAELTMIGVPTASIR